MNQAAFATAVSLGLSRSGASSVCARRGAGAGAARVPSRRVRMAVDEPDSTAVAEPEKSKDSVEPALGSGEETSAATMTSDSFNGPPVAVLATDDDDDFELPEGEEIVELTPPAFAVNAAAIAEARTRFRRHESDTGSAEYQIATLTTRIQYLTSHLKKNPKDFASTRGLLKMVGRRRRLLKFLKSEDPSRFRAILEGMNIRVSQELRAM